MYGQQEFEIFDLIRWEFSNGSTLLFFYAYVIYGNHASDKVNGASCIKYTSIEIYYIHLIRLSHRTSIPKWSKIFGANRTPLSFRACRSAGPGCTRGAAPSSSRPRSPGRASPSGSPSGMCTGFKDPTIYNGDKNQKWEISEIFVFLPLYLPCRKKSS